MPGLNGNERWTYGTRFEDDKHIAGTARLKELDNEDMPKVEIESSRRKKFIERAKEHWILDFMPVIIETTIWVWIVGRFFGAEAYITYVIPFSYLSVILLIILYVEINEWFVFNFNRNKVRKSKV